MKHSFFALVLLIFCCNSSVAGNGNPTDDCFREKNESVFVHLQKQTYVAGEQLNYKAYVVTLANLVPTNKSKVLYFCIRDVNNKVVMTWRTNLEAGVCSGSISLSDTISSGVYTLSAFTNWMRNLSTGHFFHSRIMITKMDNKKDEKLLLPVSENPGKSIVSFFPEGGTLVAGISNVVGVRVNDRMNLVNVIGGAIKDDEDYTVDTLLFSSMGIAKFEIDPRSDRAYSAHLFTRDRGVVEVALPVPVRKGYVLQARDSAGGITVNIYTNAIDEQLFLEVRSKGRVIDHKALVVDNGVSELRLEKSSLPEGVISLTVIDTNRKILAERLVYSKKETRSGLKILDLKQEYQKGEKIQFEIESVNFSANDTLNFSISVSAVHPFHRVLGRDDVDTHFYLSSEIENFAFSGDDFKENVQMNDLLLVVDPAHYVWQNGISNREKKCEYLVEDKGFVLTGKVLKNDIVASKSATMVLLSRIDSIPSLDYSYVDEAGQFHFLLDKQYDNKELVLQLTRQNMIEEGLTWKLEDKYETQERSDTYSTSLNTSEVEYLELSRKLYLIENIYRDIKASEYADSSQSGSSFFGDANYTVRPASYIALNHFTDISANLLPAVRFRSRKNSSYLYIADNERKQFFENAATVLFNGVPFFDLSYLQPLGTRDIQKIDVVTSKLFYGDLTFYGLVSINTKDGEVPSSYLKNYTHFLQNPVGKSSRRDVHFSNNRPVNPNSPNLTQSLYWQPEVKIHANNKISIEFFASDLHTMYEMKIQGVTTNGVPFSKSSKFEVR